MEPQQPPAAATAADLADAELARRIAAADGDVAEIEEAELCRRFERRIYWYGLRHLRAEDRARDLVQEVLVVTLEKLRSNQVREPERIGSFILGVARMVARTMSRTGARDETIEQAAAIPAADGSVADPLARDRVVHCLDQLAERPRTVIVLTYYGEESTAAIASSLGLSANNVRVIRHRGMAELRSCLGLTDPGAAA